MKRLIGSFLKNIVSESTTLTNVLRVLVGNADFSNFIKRFKESKLVEGKTAFYTYINDQQPEQSLFYLEFGVHKGESIKEWAMINKHPLSVFYGFDSFEGLPENWQWNTGKKIPKGTFSTDGNIPAIEDKRVHFVKGLFQNTLFAFLKEHGATISTSRVIAHFDADLYSSGLFCLSHLYEYLPDDSIIFFDDFFVVNHDFRSLTDWSHSHLVDLEMIAHMPDYKRAAFKIRKRNTY